MHNTADVRISVLTKTAVGKRKLDVSDGNELQK